MAISRPAPEARTAIYCRVSTLEQADGVSLEDQEKDCRNYASLYKLPLDIEVYRDAETGTTLDRKDMQRLLADAKAGKFSHFVVYSIDRAARSAADFLYIDKQLGRYGVTRSYVREHFDTSTAVGKFTATIMAAVAELEHSTIKTRTTNGRNGKIKKGHYWAADRWTPYGYRYYPPDVRAALPSGTCDANGWSIVESEAAIVRRIFADIASGRESGNSIAKRLNQEGIPTRRSDKGSVWQHSTITTMLHHTWHWYIGQAPYGETERVKTVDDDDNDRIVTRKREGGPLCYVPVPKIIDETLAQAALARFSGNRSRTKGNTKHEYLLKDVLYCGVCAGEGRTTKSGMPPKMGALYSSSRGTRRYRCKFIGDDGGAHHHSLTAHLVEEAVWSGLHGVLNNPGTILDDATDDAAGQATSLEARIGTLTKQIDALDGQINGLMGYIGIWTREQIVAKVRELQGRQEALLARRDDLGRERDTAQRTMRQAQHIRDIAALYRDGLDNLTFEEKRQLIQLFIKQVVATPYVWSAEGAFPALVVAGEVEQPENDVNLDVMASRSGCNALF